MERKDFIEKAIAPLELDFFERLKGTLIDRYIPFSFIEKERIDKIILQEKLSDYFETESLAAERDFDHILEKYASDLDSVVAECINRYSNPKKKTISRAKKYYDRVHEMGKQGLESFQDIVDYSRIMLCLYMSIINNNHKKIIDFDYSSENLKGAEIVTALKNEVTSKIVGKKKRFQTKEPYGSDRSTFVILTMVYYYIKNKEMEAGI